MYPNSFENLMLELHNLPGVGMKSAERMAFAILNWPKAQQEQLAQAIRQVSQLHACKICGNLCEGDICSICGDSTRDQTQICVVQSEKDLYAIENLHEYHGLYHVLHGAINIQKGILPDHLNIEELEKRITPQIQEVILALDSNAEGETTARYIALRLEGKALITKLASGLPFGGKLDYADARTLSKAFAGRQKENGQG